MIFDRPRGERACTSPLVTSNWSRCASAALCSAVLCVTLAGCASEGGAIGRAEAPVVYGSDDRMEVYEHPSALYRGIAKSAVAALIPDDALVDQLDGTYAIDALPLSELIFETEGAPLCDGERFADEPTAAYCSSTLIDDDLVLTAGHCAMDAICPEWRIVFDYDYVAEGQLDTIDADDVYACAEVVAYELTDDSFDFAILRLDRPVVDREPVAVDVDYTVGTGDPVAVLGFGDGLPCKIDDGGTVLDDRSDERDFFVASTDTFSGNSGSGVFDEGGTLVGLLVRGQEDWVEDGEPACAHVNVIALEPVAPTQAEEIVYAGVAIEALCARTPAVDTSLCDAGVPVGAGGGSGDGGDGVGGGEGGGGGGASHHRYGGCAAAPGASAPFGFSSLVLALGVMARRRSVGRRRGRAPRPRR